MTYQLTTLADVFNKVPADKIELCMAEIGLAMALAKATSIDLEVQMVWPEVTEWIDDGKGEVGFDLVDANGQNILAATITKEGK